MTTLLTAEQVHAQELLPYKPRTLLQYAREGRIGHVRLSERKIRFRPEDIAEFIASGATRKAAATHPSRNPKYATR